MDINRSLRGAAETGSVLLGTKESLQAVRDGRAKLVILAANATADERTTVRAAARDAAVPLHEFGGTNHDLGSACGKPFTVACLTILDAGESDILQLARHTG